MKPFDFLQTTAKINHSGHRFQNGCSVYVNHDDESGIFARPESSKICILYLEDEKDLVTLVQLIFSRQGYHIVGARNIAQAKEIIERESIDLFFLDLNLPDGTGWEMLDYLSNHAHYASTPKIIMSAQNSIQSGLTELDNQNRFSAIVSKPFQVNTLIDVTQRLLSRAKSSY